MEKKIRVVFFICTLTVIAATAWSLIRSHRPGSGKTYERLSAEEADEYMSFESVYCVLDVRSAKDYEKGHLDGARNLPLIEIVKQADQVIPDRGMMLYVYGYASEDSCAAAQKLSDMGFTSVTETGSYEDWVRWSGQKDNDR